jgi:hypothetical protein
MSDDVTPQPSPPGVCPWCSAPLGAADAATCPSCGAKLHGEGDGQPLPGLTAIDPLAIVEGRRPPQQPRNRLVAWLTGGDIEETAETSTAAPGALAPPAPEVKLEMMRLEMDAELSKLSAEVDSRVADEALARSESGDDAGAKAAVDAMRVADSEVDALVESPEERQIAIESGAEPVATPSLDDVAEAIAAEGGRESVIEAALAEVADEDETSL